MEKGLPDSDQFGVSSRVSLFGELGNSLGYLEAYEGDQLHGLIHIFSCLFHDASSCSRLLEHDIDVGDAKPIKQQMCRVHPKKCELLKS